MSNAIGWWQQAERRPAARWSAARVLGSQSLFFSADRGRLTNCFVTLRFAALLADVLNMSLVLPCCRSTDTSTSASSVVTCGGEAVMVRVEVAVVELLLLLLLVVQSEVVVEAVLLGAVVE